MKRIGLTLAVLICIATVVLGTAEIYHHIRFGDFFGYGLHTDVILGDSDIESNDTYFARLWNFSATPLEMEGCVEASDVGGVPDSVLYRWDVQKRDSANQRWVSLHGADTWVSTEFGGYWKEEGCRPVMTALQPLRSRKVAWVYKDWVTTREPIRIAFHTSVTKSPEAQTIIYTILFVVNPATPAAR